MGMSAIGADVSRFTQAQAVANRPAPQAQANKAAGGPQGPANAAPATSARTDTDGDRDGDKGGILDIRA
jgi:hypothetical protein